jgi:hypothetical protein
MKMTRFLLRKKNKEHSFLRKISSQICFSETIFFLSKKKWKDSKNESFQFACAVKQTQTPM